MSSEVKWVPIWPRFDGSLRVIWNLFGKLWRLLDWKNVNVPTCVVLSCFLHYTSLNATYFTLQYHGVEPKTEAVPCPQAPSLYPSSSALIGLGPVHIPDQVLLLSLLNPLCHSDLSENLTVNGVWCACLVNIVSDGFVLHITRFFGVTKVSGFGSPLLAAC